MKKPFRIPVAILIVLAGIILCVSGCSKSADTAAAEDVDTTKTEQGVSDAEIQSDTEDETEEPITSTLAEDEQSVNTVDVSFDEDDPEERVEVGTGTSGEEPTLDPSVITITGDEAWTDWDTFLSLTPEEQDRFMRSFESPEAFAAWMRAAQTAWAAAHPMEEIGPGSVIDLGGG